MIRINTNITALIANNNAKKVDNNLLKTLERLSTGMRINSASDDPAGLIASENLKMEISGTRQSIENAQRASNMVSTAEAALNEISDMLIDIKQLILESANSGSSSEEQLEANQRQIDSYLKTLNRIGMSTEFDGIKLLDGSRDYTVSGLLHPAATNVTDALSATFTSAFSITGITMKNAYKGMNLGSYDLDVNFLVSGVQAHYTWSGTADFINTSNNGDSAALQITGYKGTASVDFSGGLAGVTDIVNGINTVKDTTGVSAGISAGNLVFSSTNYGSDAFVSVTGVKPSEITWTPDAYFFSGAPLGEAGITITGNDGQHSYFAGYTNASELATMINNDAAITGVMARVDGSDMVIYSADQNGSASISVNKFATYLNDGSFANGSPASYNWNTVSDYISVLADSDGSLNIRGINGSVTISLSSGTWTEAALATEINNHTGSTGVTASGGAGTLTLTSTDGSGANFVFADATDSFSDSATPLSYEAAGTGHAIGYSDANFVTSGSELFEITAITLSSFDGIIADGSGETQQFYAATRASATLSGSNLTGTGGMEFGIDSTVQNSNDAILGLPEINTTNLGNSEYGTLNDLFSNNSSSMQTGKFNTAINVVDTAIKQISNLRGRLGSFKKYTIDSTIRTQTVKLENLASAESTILDADFAQEISELTRAQILKQNGIFIQQAINIRNYTALKLLESIS